MASEGSMKAQGHWTHVQPCIAFLPGGWLTYWKQPDELLGLKMPEGDYRDRLPSRPEDVARVYEGLPRMGLGRWA
ncbi:hypothetical protein WJX84_011609 [Apatococcus fuscideae]|uniref:Uncharacterized protein n=1 Tax=Apatococcus fuscideae TaxID=2026836 RepID=A0AAW1TD59_9CHLO